MYFINHNYYEGYWKDDLFQGKGRIVYKDNEVYEGDFFEGKKQGFGKS